MIEEDNIYEFVGQVIDTFEDFLEERNIELPDTIRFMREAGCSEKEIEENDAIIYGDDYNEIESLLCDLLANWDLIKYRE